MAAIRHHAAELVRAVAAWLADLIESPEERKTAYPDPEE